MSTRYFKPEDHFDKPAKPTPDFPLFPHANGCWAKKIRGKLHYFGPWDDGETLRRRGDSQDRLLIIQELR